MSDTLASSAGTGFDYLGAYRRVLPAGGDSDRSSLLPCAEEQAWPAERREISFDVRPSTARKSWYAAVVHELLHLLNDLGSDWNGYGEKEPHPASAKRVVQILEAVEYVGPAPAIVPLATGGLQLEWHGARGSVEIEVPPTGDATAWVTLDGDDDWIVNRGDGVRRLATTVRELQAG